jgi:hypothetical protein
MLRKQFRINIESSESSFFLSLFSYTSPVLFGKSFEPVPGPVRKGILQRGKMTLAHFVPSVTPTRRCSHHIFIGLNPYYRTI